jgi:23S rRNA (cytosine1962-C5)-methyltransferase
MSREPPLLGVELQPGREKSVQQRHPWIFSKAVRSCTGFQHGDVAPVYSASKALLGYATLSLSSQIRCRMLSFGEKPYLDAIREHIVRAVALRRCCFDERETNGYRLINGEGG